MRKYLVAGLLAGLLSGASTIAIAQGTGTTGDQSPAQTETQTPGQAGAAMPATGMDQKQITAAEGQNWIGKRVFSQDGEDIGEVAALQEGADGNVEYFRADLGGFLGMGETKVKVQPNQLEMRDDKLHLKMTKDEAKALPKVEASETKPN